MAVSAIVTIDASATITRPSDTTPYASGDLVANSVTANLVNASQFPIPRNQGAIGEVLGVRIQKSTNTSTAAAFRLHLFTVTPTFTSAGDNSLLNAVVVAAAKGYLGYVDVTAMTGFQDVAWGTGAVDSSRLVLPFVQFADTKLYGVLEARGAYVPGSAEVFTLSLFVELER